MCALDLKVAEKAKKKVDATEEERRYHEPGSETFPEQPRGIVVREIQQTSLSFPLN